LTQIHEEVEEGILQEVTMPVGVGLTIKGQMVVRGQNSDLAAVIVTRLGGPSGPDREFRTRLYQLVGSVTVAGGQIEAQMKRLIVLLKRSEDHSFTEQIEGPWGKIARLLRAEAEGALGTDTGPMDAFGTRPTSMPARILTALDWAAEQDLANVRNDFIHANWWDYADTGVSRSRFLLGGESQLQHFTWDFIQKESDDFQEFLRMLDEIVADQWSRFYLPRAPSLPKG
jgi:hypothetical protein